MNIGDRVRFKSYCFEGPHAHHYEAYQGHEFVVTSYLVDPEDGEIRDHVGLAGDVEVKGYVHAYDLERV